MTSRIGERYSTSSGGVCHRLSELKEAPGEKRLLPVRRIRIVPAVAAAHRLPVAVVALRARRNVRLRPHLNLLAAIREAVGAAETSLPAGTGFADALAFVDDRVRADEAAELNVADREARRSDA